MALPDVKVKERKTMEYCNPLNLNYKYQHFGDKAHREGAAPTLLLFKDRYYLFVSMSAGFYYSDDLMHWDWHENRALDMYNYAPDARQIGDYVYFCAVRRARGPSAITFASASLRISFTAAIRCTATTR